MGVGVGYKISLKKQGIASRIMEDIGSSFSVFFPVIGLAAGSFFAASAAQYSTLNGMVVLAVGSAGGMAFGAVAAVVGLYICLYIGMVGDSIIRAAGGLFRRSKKSPAPTPAVQPAAVAPPAPLRTSNLKKIFNKAKEIAVAPAQGLKSAFKPRRDLTIA